MPKNKQADAVDAVDLHVGALLRQHRVAQGISLARMGKATGIAYQQIQRYETGENRISAGVLWKMAQFLKVPVNSLFAGLSDETYRGQGILDRDAMEIIRAYKAIPDHRTRRSLKHILGQVAKLSADHRSEEDADDTDEAGDTE